jgi:hypothetical protein
MADELRDRLDREMRMLEEHRVRLERETQKAEELRARYDAAVAGHAPSRGRVTPTFVAMAGVALAMMLVFLAGRGVPVASAHGVEGSNVATSVPAIVPATTARASCAETTTAPVATIAAATPEAAAPRVAIAIAKAAPARVQVARVAPTLAPKIPTAPVASTFVDADAESKPADAETSAANAKDARLERAARTAALLRSQLDAAP